MIINQVIRFEPHQVIEQEAQGAAGVAFQFPGIKNKILAHLFPDGLQARFRFESSVKAVKAVKTGPHSIAAKYLDQMLKIFRAGALKLCKPGDDLFIGTVNIPAGKDDLLPPGIESFCFRTFLFFGGGKAFFYFRHKRRNHKLLAAIGDGKENIKRICCGGDNLVESLAFPADRGEITLENLSLSFRLQKIERLPGRELSVSEPTDEGEGPEMRRSFGG